MLSWGIKEGDLPESELASHEVLSLPVHPDLSREQVEYAADAVQAIFRIGSPAPR